MGYDFFLHLAEHPIDGCVQEYDDTEKDEDGDSIGANEDDSDNKNDHIFIDSEKAMACYKNLFIVLSNLLCT